MRRVAPRPPGLLLTTLPATLLSLVLVAGCTSSDDDPAEPETTGSAQAQSSSVKGTAKFNSISGKLAKQRRGALKTKVVEAVDAWIDAAYLGDYPRTAFPGAFKRFTAIARNDARRAASTMSNQKIGGQLEAVRASKRNLRIDALAVRNKPAGATVRVQLELQLTGEVERTDRIVGSLYLSKGKKKWRIFGFDMERRQQ